VDLSLLGTKGLGRKKSRYRQYWPTILKVRATVSRVRFRVSRVRVSRSKVSRVRLRVMLVDLWNSRLQSM